MNSPFLMYLNEEVQQEVFPEDTLEKILIDSDIRVGDTVSSDYTVNVEVSECVHKESPEDLTELQSVGIDYNTFQNPDSEANFPSIHPSQLLLDQNLFCLQDTSSNRSTISNIETPSQVVSELHPDFHQITPEMPSHETMSSICCNSLHEMTIQDRPHPEYSPEEHQQRVRITSQKFDEKTELNTQNVVATPPCDASTKNAQNESPIQMPVNEPMKSEKLSTRLEISPENSDPEAWCQIKVPYSMLQSMSRGTFNPKVINGRRENDLLIHDLEKKSAGTGNSMQQSETTLAIKTTAKKDKKCLIKRSPPLLNDVKEQDFDSVCPACNDKASTHVHYGGRSCHSCRAFFRRSIININSLAGFSYPCSCKQQCSKMAQPVCPITKDSRRRCKDCRFRRCETLAKMVRAYVISPIKTNPSGIGKDTDNLIKKEGKKVIALIKGLTKIFEEESLIDSELIEDVKRQIYSSNQAISKKTASSLEMIMAQQVHKDATKFDDFAKLKFTSRAKLMLRNNNALIILRITKFMYDYIWKYTYEESCWFSILDRVLQPNQPNSECQLPKEERRNTNTFIKKMDALVKRHGNEIVFFLFPIILLECTGTVVFNSTNVYTIQIDHMRSLEEFISFKTKWNRKKTAIELGIANDLISVIQEI